MCFPRNEWARQLLVRVSVKLNLFLVVIISLGASNIAKRFLSVLLFWRGGKLAWGRGYHINSIYFGSLFIKMWINFWSTFLLYIRNFENVCEKCEIFQPYWKEKKSSITNATYPLRLIICFFYTFLKYFNINFRYYDISPLIFLCILFKNDIFLHKWVTLN